MLSRSGASIKHNVLDLHSIEMMRKLARAEFTDYPNHSPIEGKLGAVRERTGSLAELIVEFEKSATRLVEDRQLRFDVIHASDWVTFGAASLLSRQIGPPRIAHFHSTEAERRGTCPNGRIVQAEQ